MSFLVGGGSAFPCCTQARNGAGAHVDTLAVRTVSKTLLARQARSTSEQATRLANARWVLSEVKKAREAWGAGLTLTLPPALERFFAQSDRAAEAELRALENPSAEQIAAANATNRRMTKELERTHRYGAKVLLAHGTHAEHVPEILRSANYDAIFDLANPHDTPTLGCADAVRIVGRGPLLTTREVRELANGGFGNVALLYDPARLDASRLKEARGTEYNDHWTYAVALPNTALVAIQLLGPVDAGALATLERSVAARGFAVPIVTARS